MSAPCSKGGWILTSIAYNCYQWTVTLLLSLNVNMRLEHLRTIKGAQSFFQNWCFFVSFEESSLQSFKFIIWVETVKPFGWRKQFCDLQLPIHVPYCVSSIMVTIIWHIFINIFQTKNISAIKYDTGYEKNIWAFLWLQNLQKFDKKSKKIWWAPLA